MVGNTETYLLGEEGGRGAVYKGRNESMGNPEVSRQK